MKLFVRVVTSFVTLYIILGLFIGFHVWQQFNVEVPPATGGQAADDAHAHHESHEGHSVSDAEGVELSDDRSDDELDVESSAALVADDVDGSPVFAG